MSAKSESRGNYGIRAIEVYFPSQYVDQEELEQFDGVSAGKYTVGLAQKRMAFCSDVEDVNSLCLTVVHNLMKRHSIDYSWIGRVEVGTETIVDKSKSVKSVLMQLFKGAGVTDVEGVDCTNACYGGTAALFNSLDWLQSSACHDRLALVVCADIAVYASGSARPTGGAGAVAMLLGPHAPLVIENELRSSCMEHVYDFYKPDLTSEYPVVDGKLSIQCYFSALDRCYSAYRQRSHKLKGEKVSVDSFDAVLFHCPYGKLVQKSLARLVFNDFLTACSGKPDHSTDRYSSVEQFKDKRLEETYFDRDVEKAFMTLSSSQFNEKTRSSLLLASNIGNMYTPSLYSCLISLLLSKSVDQLSGNRLCLFSYGSGLAASMFSIRCEATNGLGSKLHSLVDGLKDVVERLESRDRVAPERFVEILSLRQKAMHKAPFSPEGAVDVLFPGTYYLTHIDDKHRRFYRRHGNNSSQTSNGDHQNCQGH